VAGTEVADPLSFLLLVGLLAWLDFLQGGVHGAIEGTIFLLLIFLCVLAT